MINKTDRIVHFFNLGETEGRLDWLFKSEFSTIEDRAAACFVQCGHKTYKRYFVSGYQAGVQKGQ